jgi:hypothetical protein
MNQLAIWTVAILMFVSGNSVLAQEPGGYGWLAQEREESGWYGWLAQEMPPEQQRKLLVTPQRIQEAVEHAAKEQQEHWL